MDVVVTACLQSICLLNLRGDMPADDPHLVVAPLLHNLQQSRDVLLKWERCSWSQTLRTAKTWKFFLPFIAFII